MNEVQEGYSSVINILFDQHYKELSRYAFSILKNQEESEDIVQKLFVKLWEKRTEMDAIENIRAYLYRSVYNMSLNAQKRASRSTSLEETTVLQTLTEPGDSSETVVSGELNTLIHQAVNSLPEKCRVVFQLSRFEQLSYREISEQLNISTKTVENQIGKALKVMREALKEYMPLLVLTILLLNR